MINYYNRVSTILVFYFIIILTLMAGNTFAQLVTNGSFESSNTGVVNSSDIRGWLIQVAQGVNPPPVFEIVSDTVEQGNRALKVTVNGLGSNQWDIQVIADSIPVTPGATYNYSIWAKAERPGVQVNFTMGNYSFTEYKAIRPANLTTQWKKYTMQFIVNDNQTFIRGPIHFNYAADTGNAIYIDNLQIDTVKVYQGPPLAEGQAKFLGNAYGDVPDNVFANYWNQLTPGNAGKFGSVGISTDTSQWNWNGLNAAYNYAINNHLIFKDHTLIWGQQQPSWISGFDSAQQANYIETWIRMVGQRYPQIDMIDVVNEPLPNHNPPDGGGTPPRANYKNALGGNGTTGWDWVINSFQLARKYLPNAKLLINDYGIINDNTATTSYLQVINLLKDRELIDGIGVQGHRFELEIADTTTIKSNLNRLAATGLPIYISEFDLGNLENSGTPDDNQQLQLYQKIFPILWKHTGVKGITLWGYLENQMWQVTCYLVNSDGSSRPALQWLAQYLKESPVGVRESISEKLPLNFELKQNYPNPFNPSTKIRWKSSIAAWHNLKLYDLLGNELATLVDEYRPAGMYEVELNAKNLSSGVSVKGGFASGVYFYRLICGDFIQIKKMLFAK